ncbi:hypothetical protein ElP_72120 (plasmid) [Tautonia plasticadhaerens]|uniref:SHOCT domain-containing protein n=1 Tax=Tautonia plasticadhaerens TaxID=2527974 RepID=A0A518HEI6_9BACT|nr:hypothetical protein ElP_72120 [Tautonia plasticadhaerens]
MPMGMMYDEGSMPALHHELSTLAQLLGEGIVTQEEWLARKAKSLEEPLSPGDLRADLVLVRQLAEAGAINEEERASLRARLLGIEGPQDHGSAHSRMPQSRRRRGNGPPSRPVAAAPGRRATPEPLREPWPPRAGPSRPGPCGPARGSATIGSKPACSPCQKHGARWDIKHGS